MATLEWKGATRNQARLEKLRKGQSFHKINFETLVKHDTGIKMNQILSQKLRKGRRWVWWPNQIQHGTHGDCAIGHFLAAR